MSKFGFEPFFSEPSLNISNLYTIYHHHFGPGYVFDGQRHDFYEINFILNGELGLNCDNSLFRLKAGQAYIIKPNVFHKNWVNDSESVEMVVISFDLNKIPDVDFEDSIYFPDRDKAGLFNILVQEADKFYMKKNLDGSYCLTQKDGIPFGSTQIIKNTLEIILIDALRRSTAVEQLYTFSSQTYFKAINFMTENISSNLSVDQIAKYCNVSSPYIKKMFKKYVGMGVIRYFTDMKIAYSKALLRKGYSISQVSEMLTFSSQNYYSTVFKRITGISPQKYKKQHVHGD